MYFFSQIYAYRIGVQCLVRKFNHFLPISATCSHPKFRNSERIEINLSPLLHCLPKRKKSTSPPKSKNNKITVIGLTFETHFQKGPLPHIIKSSSTRPRQDKSVQKVTLHSGSCSVSPYSAMDRTHSVGHQNVFCRLTETFRSTD